MSCRTVLKSLSPYLDKALSRSESEGVTLHLAGCRECAARTRELTQVRKLLLATPQRQVPAKLASELRVLASHEKARRSRSRWANCVEWMRLAVDNLMRPVAIPFAGGLASA